MKKHKSKEQWEESFIICLVRLRDYFLEQDAKEIVGVKRAQVVENIVNCYFEQRRNLVPIPECSPFMACGDIAEFINDTILSYIYDETCLLTMNWKQVYTLVKEEEEESDFLDDLL